MVTTIFSVAEFTDWLLPKGKRLCDIKLLSQHANQYTLSIEGIKEDSIIPEDKRVLSLLFRQCSKVILTPLSGGYSGSTVYKAQSFDSLGHRLSSCVVKLGPRNMIAKEQMNFERVEEILGNNAPRTKSYVDLNERAGIKLAFASMSEENVQNLETVYKSNCSQVRINQILTYLFEEILGRFYAVSQYERIRLFDCYNFDGRGWAWFKGGSDTPEKVKERVHEILKTDGNSEHLKFPGENYIRNVAIFLEKDFPKLSHNDLERHYVSYVHGDLHGGNILIDPNENIWLIDFFFTERTHVLKDIAKVENEILYLFTNPHNEEELIEGIKIITTLATVNDLGVSLPEKLEGVTSPSMVRAWESIRVLRNITRNIIKQERNPLQMSIVLLRYALHNMCLDSLKPNQRIMSLAAACAHAEIIRLKYQKQHGPIIVYWIGKNELHEKNITGRLGITILPGRKDKGRSLESDLKSLQSYGVKRLLCLSQQSELEESEITHLPQEMLKLGFKFLFSPLKDQTIPSFHKLYEVFEFVLEGISNGEDTVIFCHSGLGRSGTAAACVLASLDGMTGEKAIEIVRRDRGTSRAIERKVQENMILYFGKAFKDLSKKGSKQKSLPNMRFFRYTESD